MQIFPEINPYLRGYSLSAGVALAQRLSEWDSTQETSEIDSENENISIWHSYLTCHYCLTTPDVLWSDHHHN